MNQSKKQKSIFYFLIVLGLINILVGTYNAFDGKEFSNYFFTIFIGFTLVGTAWLQLKSKNTTHKS